jgi:hypothetical protein
MKDKNGSDGHKTETPDVSYIRNVEVTHERSDISVRGVFTFVIALTIAALAIHIGVWVLFRYFDAQEAKEPGRGPMAFTEKKDLLPPEPRLQAAPGFQVTTEDGRTVPLEKAAPQAEYGVLRQQWQENLKTGLKDQSGNVVGMPIEQAMQKVVNGTNGKLSDYAISMPTAASSGRETEKRLQ